MSTKMQKMAAALMALQLVAFGALAQDAGLEFGAEDDMTIKGTGGNLNDADLEVKGYSVFGDATGVAVPSAFTNGAGSVVVTSNLWVRGQLKAGGIDLQGANMTVSNLTVQGSFSATGDSVSFTANTTASTNLSVGNNVSIGNDLTVTDDASVGGDLSVDQTLTVDGATILNSTLTVDGSGVFNTNVLINATTPSTSKDTGALVVEGGVGIEKNLNVGGNSGVTGNSTVGGTLGVTGDATFGNDVDVTGARERQLARRHGQRGCRRQSNRDRQPGCRRRSRRDGRHLGRLRGDQRRRPRWAATLDVTGAATIADTTESTDKDTGSLVLEGGLGVEKNINAGGNLGVTGNATVGGTLGITGAATADNDLTVKGNLMVWGTGTFSNDVTTVQDAFLATTAAAAVGVGTATPDAQTKLDVRGGGSSGNYAAKFYAGTDLAAWIRKK